MSNSYDPIDTCPYDPVHRIMRSRMQYHLTKCSKNWPCSKKKQCPYNARHVVNQIEYNYHVSICPQRESALHDKLEEHGKVEDLGILPIDSSPVVVPAEEIWEEEGNVQSYDPIKYTENKLVTRILIGAPKSQRKKHRLQERLRISRLADDAPKKEKDPATQRKNNQHAASTTKPSIPKEASVEVKQVYQPLRFPKESTIDTSNTSKIATINDSTVVHQIQNSFNQNEPLQFLQEKTNANVDLDPQTMFNYAAAAKNVLTNHHQQYSSIESDYDVIESKQCDNQKENNNSLFFNRNKENLNLQTTCNYAAAAKNILTNQRQQCSSIESDYDVIESKKYNTEKENNNSTFLNSNKAFDLQASTFSYAAATKNALDNQEYSYIESDYDFNENKKWGSEKEDNNSSFVNKNKEYSDLQATTFNYAAATKYVPLNCQLNSRMESDYNLESTKFSYATANKNELTNQPQRNSNIECDYDMHTASLFRYETTTNALINRRPRINSTESDYDMVIDNINYNTEKEYNSLFFNNAIDENLVKVTKTIETLSSGDEGHKVQSESLDRKLESLNRTTNYSSIIDNGLNRIQINKPLTSKKKTSRCAADLHFTNLRQYLQNTK